MDAPTREEIRGLCTEQSFRRGVNYHDEGRVTGLDVDGNSVRATVRGSRVYEVSVELDGLGTHCTCPYDYAGDCKHVVATLLAVRERVRDDASGGDTDPEATDVATLVDETPAEELRAFLRDVVAEDSDLRARFVAFAGGETGRTVDDYRREIDRLFDRAAGRGGFVEYGTHIDFSTYHDLAETRRERGHVEEATAIYRALAAVIAERFDRVDDSDGHYSRELERAVEGYAETVREHADSHDERRPHIEHLFDGYLADRYGFVADYYDEALRTVCVTDADLEHWLGLLDEQVAGIDLSGDPPARPSAPTTAGDEHDEANDGADERGRRDAELSGRESEEVLYVSDFTEGPLRVEEFTGGALDVEHLAVGGLELAQFAGDAFEELRVDEPTTVETHTFDRAETTTSPGGDHAGTAVSTSASVSTRTLLASCIHVLDELGREETLLALYECSYLESRMFCRQYAERLADRGEYDRALAVVADGVETFRSTRSLRRFAATLYRERGRDGDDRRSWETLRELFVDHGDWEAYEELKASVTDEEWADVRAEFVDALEAGGRRVGPDRAGQRLVELHLREDDHASAFERVVERGTLDWLEQYREDLADVDPEQYFEAYREQLVPFAANDTGRKHYREIATHLGEMRALGLDGRFEEFLGFLKEKHSNRPAFLDELEQAGF